MSKRKKWVVQLLDGDTCGYLSKIGDGYFWMPYPEDAMIFDTKREAKDMAMVNRVDYVSAVSLYDAIIHSIMMS